MYDVIIDFLKFLGVATDFTPLTVSDFLVWFVFVCVSISIIKYILSCFFWLVALVKKGGY